MIDLSAPAAPTELRLKQGEVSGSAVARYKSQKGRPMNEVWKCIGDPNVEANWMMVGTFQGGKASITGITPGTVLWVRVRTIGLKGVVGAWSDPAKIMVV